MLLYGIMFIWLKENIIGKGCHMGILSALFIQDNKRPVTGYFIVCGKYNGCKL